MNTAVRLREPQPAIQLKNVLFATDFSQASTSALPYAASMAKDFGGRVFVCHIVTPTALAIGAPEAAPYLFGDQLREAVNNYDIDLVVAGTHGHSGMRRLLLGSAVEEICRVSPCPVLTVGPDIALWSKGGFETILYPTDLSGESIQALPYAKSVAERYGAKVIFLHVVPIELARNPQTVKLEEPLRERTKQLVEKKLGTVETEFMIEAGEPVETILNVARQRNADLIAMGVRNTFAPGVQLRSSIAYQVITGAHCPVLTYRS